MQIGVPVFQGAVSCSSAINGASEKGGASNTTENITAGSTYTLTVTLSKGGYTCGEARLSIAQHGSVTAVDGCSICFTKTTNDGFGGECSGYGQLYSRYLGDAWLSRANFGTDILLQSATLSAAGDSIAFVFKNMNASTTRTLSVYLFYEVFV